MSGVLLYKLTAKTQTCMHLRDGCASSIVYVNLTLIIRRDHNRLLA